MLFRTSRGTPLCAFMMASVITIVATCFSVRETLACSQPTAPKSSASAALDSLPTLPTSSQAKNISTDYLIQNTPFVAQAFQSVDQRELVLQNGLIRRSWRIAPNGACVAFDNLSTGDSLLRSVRAEARVTLNGVAYEVGGLAGQPNHAFLTPAWLDAMTSPPNSFRLVDIEVGEPVERFGWQQNRHHAPDVKWPPAGVYLRMDYAAPSATDASTPTSSAIVSIHYEMYDGVPVMSKWITVTNYSAHELTVDRFTAEELAIVEQSNWVEKREGVPQSHPSSLHVETDFAFGGMHFANANRHVVGWRSDPLYQSQVNYLRQNPCLLVVEPTYGPAQTLAPNETFESFRTFELVYDSSDRERRGLALRRMYRTIAPWITENPLMHHMRNADLAQVRQAIDQAAEVDFEMIILSFGSGFNIENEDPDYLAAWKEMAKYAQSKGVEIGGYSLLSSRRIGNGNDVESPAGEKPTHGNCPALLSEWGRDYFRKLYAFFAETGFTLLEHDGSYPGDVDVTARPPWQKGEADSRWVQWRKITQFYQWCRANGIYLNVPDYYYLSGSNKSGMGYREVNWSLPRAQQVIHTRQNIHDGTWTKTPSMGWMFVPLSQYHGGGAAATIEPLAEHLDHYQRMLFSNLALGVQACFRGPRLYDTAATRDLLKGWVDWYRKYRDILESDLVHGRRADGRDLDWMLHVNPRLNEQGMLAVFNPLTVEVTKTIRVNLYYTGLTKTAWVSVEGANANEHELARDYTIDLEVTVPAGGMRWYVIGARESAVTDSGG